MTSRRRAAAVVLAAAAAASCARHAAPVSPELRAVVGRELALDASRIGPDASLVAFKPELDELATVALVLRLEEAFNVDINDDAVADVLGMEPHGLPTKLTLNNLARLIATAPHAAPRPAAAPPPPAPPEARPSPPTLVDGGYEYACELPGLEPARARVERDRRLSLLVGRRVADTAALDGEFHGADAEVTCANGFVTLRRKQPDGRDRFVSFAWKGGHLAPRLSGNEVR
jgi:acyl carrier protein